MTFSSFEALHIFPKKGIVKVVCKTNFSEIFQGSLFEHAIFKIACYKCMYFFQKLGVSHLLDWE